MDYAFLAELIKIDSPTGFTDTAAAFVHHSLESLGLRPKKTRKGAISCCLSDSPTIAFAAHLDTLGAVVSSITHSGTLRISPLGGLLFPSFEGAYCKIYSRSSSVTTGTLLLDNPSAHTNNNAASSARTAESMHIRLDEEINSMKECLQRGIAVGDIVAFETNYQECSSGFIKSRFLDNKAGCFVLYELARLLTGSGAPVQLFFSNYEEVGHGGAVGILPSVEDLIVIDMGVVGGTTQGKETAVSICAKDSGGPYDYSLRAELVQLAAQENIPAIVDVYPHYTSDGTAAWRSGLDARVGLVGPGVAASHGMERTHKKGIEATVRLLQTLVTSRANP